MPVEITIFEDRSFEFITQDAAGAGDDPSRPLKIDEGLANDARS